MAQLQIHVRGERGSGKTTMLSHVKLMLNDFGIDHRQEICESNGAEVLTVFLSKNDLQALQKKE